MFCISWQVGWEGKTADRFYVLRKGMADGSPGHVTDSPDEHQPEQSMEIESDEAIVTVHHSFANNVSS